MTRPAAPDGREPSIKDLEALAAYAAQRLALYRRRVLLGRGEPRRLAELERTSEGATARLRRARERADLAARSASTGAHRDRRAP